MNRMDNHVRVGLIINTHGVRGELLIKPLTDDPRRFEKLNQVFVENDTFAPASFYEIEYVRFQKEKLLVKFKDFDDLNRVLPLKGKYIAIDEKDIVPLPEDSYFIFDIIGCEVYSTPGEFLGTVTDVIETGSNDVYVVRPVDGSQKEILIPAVKSVVKSVSVKDKKIIADIPPEM